MIFDTCPPILADVLVQATSVEDRRYSVLVWAIDTMINAEVS